jgi:hypothetical protein
VTQLLLVCLKSAELHKVFKAMPTNSDLLAGDYHANMLPAVTTEIEELFNVKILKLTTQSMSSSVKGAMPANMKQSMQTKPNTNRPMAKK